MKEIKYWEVKKVEVVSMFGRLGSMFVTRKIGYLRNTID